MTFKELIVLLPCQTLENLSLQRGADEAEAILAGWSALYHPVLVAHAESMPRWASAESPPEIPPESLVIVPECCEPSLPYNWAEDAESAGTRVIRRVSDRDRILAAALQGFEEDLARVDPCLVGDFLALGFCHFQTEVLTRQLRYMSNLDEQRFRQHLQDAAKSAQEGDATAVREHLRSGFDRLTEAREYFYPVETYFLDLTLAASTTLGQGLRADLNADRQVNLLLSAGVLEEMARTEPESLAALKAALEKGRVTLIGGEYDEQDLPLLAIEDILAQFQRGLESYERHLGQRPVIFGRRRFGLTPWLPSILPRLGFTGAIHFTLDDGKFPSGNQSKLRWEGFDGTEIDALARIPLDVRQPESYLRLSERLGNTMDLDHAASAVFAHWPGQTSPFYEDLRRMAQYASVLGRFTTLADYFQNTLHSGSAACHEADKYRSPYLRQEVAAGRPDPISRWVRYHRRRAEADALHALTAMSNLAARLVSETAEKPDFIDPAPGSAEADDAGTKRLDEAVTQFCQTVSGAKEAASPGYLVANSASFSRQICVDVSDLESLPAVAGPVLKAAESAGRKQALVEVPGMGFAWIGPGSQAAPKKKKDDAPLVEEHQLRNEHFQATISQTTGAIQSIQNYSMRGNRLAQQIGMRVISPGRMRQKGEEPGSEEEYTIMAADEVSVVESGPLVGRIVSRGRLMDRQGTQVARFTQSSTARRGSPILELEIELEPEREPDSDPWGSYYAARFAWTDETADVSRGVDLVSRRTEANYLESPQFIDIRASRTRLTVLPGGLPYHRRFGFRKLDTLLIVQGETARRFRLGIAVDAPQPARAAVDFSLAGNDLVGRSASPANPSGWLFHLPAKEVIATHWEPIAQDGRAVGFSVRLLEIGGRHARAALQSFRSVASARKVDFLGQTVSELPVKADRITIELGPHEWTEVRAAF